MSVQYWYNAELCGAAYDRLEAAPLTHRQQQCMRIYTAQLLSRIKRVTCECDNLSRIVWPREGTSSLLVEDHTLISRQCRRPLKGELKRRRCLEFIHGIRCTSDPPSDTHWLYPVRPTTSLGSNAQIAYASAGLLAGFIILFIHM